jgi:transcriptional regulator of acetoin/glycerol metabolism
VVALAPLRERVEEIPWLAQLAVEQTASGLAIDAELIEACMLRRWPGNVRELLGEVRRIVRVAQLQSSSGAIGSELFAPHAGDAPEEAAKPSRTPVSAEQIRRALRDAPSVSAAARSLGIHRSHLYRLIRDFGIERDVESSSAH